MVASFSRGHKIILLKNKWVFADSGKPVDENHSCARCGKPPLPGGEDACMGHIPGVASACCGHGCEKPYIIRGKKC